MSTFRLPPRKIQEMFPFWSYPVAMGRLWREQNTLVQSSDGNFVNVGNFDSDGLNVNNDTRDNTNSNLGVCPSR